MRDSWWVRIFWRRTEYSRSKACRSSNHTHFLEGTTIIARSPAIWIHVKIMLLMTANKPETHQWSNLIVRSALIESSKPSQGISTVSLWSLMVPLLLYDVKVNKGVRGIANNMKPVWKPHTYCQLKCLTTSYL